MWDIEIVIQISLNSWDEMYSLDLKIAIVNYESSTTSENLYGTSHIFHPISLCFVCVVCMVSVTSDTATIPPLRFFRIETVERKMSNGAGRESREHLDIIHHGTMLLKR